MTRYFVATFPDGSKLLRSSARGFYLCAWRMIDERGHVTTGFSSTRRLATNAAEAAANAYSGLADANRYTNPRRGGAKTPEWYRYAAGIVAKNGGKAAYLAKAQAKRDECTVEVVDAVEVDRATYNAAREV